MQTSLEHLTNTRVKINIEASDSDIESFKQSALRLLATDVNVAGFRSGKAPLNLVEKHIDPNRLSQQVLELALDRLYSDTIVKQGLRPVNNPSIELKSYVPYSQLNFTAEVDVIGKITLAKYQNLSVTKDNTKVSVKDVDEVLKRIQDQLATLEEVDRAAKIKDLLVIDFEGVESNTKEKIPGASATDFNIILGSKTLIPGFEEALVGCKKDQQKTFDLTFPANYQVNSLKNKKVTFSVTINKVQQRKLPFIDDQLAKQAGPFNDLSELKSDIKKNLEDNLAKDQLTKWQNELIDKIITASKVDIPEILINDEEKRIDQEQKHNAAYAGLTWKEYLDREGLSEESYKSLLSKQAKARIKTGLILGEIASIQKVSVTKQDLENQVNAFRQQYANDQQMLAELDNANNLQDIKNRLLVDKTLQAITALNPNN